MVKVLKMFFKVLLTLVGILILGIMLFFALNSYTSPVREAGRDFERAVRSYRNDEVEDMVDVYERLAALQKHYNSTTHSKMQGGEKLKITPKHIETLFGEPAAVHNDVEMGRSTMTVYQYKYGAETLNLHEDWGGIQEFILEDYSGEQYKPEEMDNLFFKAITVQQSDYEKVEDQFEPFPEEGISAFTTENEPTRIITQAGWFTWPLDHEQYFDDGQAELSPEEFVMLKIEEDDEGNNMLEWMYRRYRDAYVEITNPEEVDKKIGILNEWNRYFKEIEDEDLKDIVTVQDLADDFGEITRLTYDFRSGVLQVNWLVMEPDHMALEVRGNIPMSGDIVATKIDDVYNLQIKSLESDHLFRDSSIVNTADFIGQ